MAKALAKWDKARTVFRVFTEGRRLKPGVTWATLSGDDALDFELDGEDDVCYALDLATARRLADERSIIDEIDRKTLTGKFSPADGMDEMGMIPCYLSDKVEA